MKGEAPSSSTGKINVEERWILGRSTN